MNKIGLSTSSTFPLPLDKSFALAAEAGYDGIEVMITNDRLTRDKTYLESLENKYSLPVLSFHAPVLLLTHFVWGTDPEVKLRKTAQLAASMDAETVVVHPPFSWQGKYSENFLQIVENISEETGTKIAVENMFPWKYRSYELLGYKPSWNTIVNKTPYVTLDFSHAALSGLNVLDTAKFLGDRLQHIHLCDGVGNHHGDDEVKAKIFDEHLLPGKGNQPVKETLQFLKNDGWEGNIVAEINTRKSKTEAGRLALLKETLVWTKNVLGDSAAV